MSRSERRTTRRGALKTLGAIGAAGALGAGGQLEAAEAPADGPAKPGRVEERGTSTSGTGPSGFVAELERKVASTPMVDTHEHLPDEEERLRGEMIPCDDWGLLFSHYIDSDLVSAGMPGGSRDRLLARGADPLEKWRDLAPWWPAVKNTGYGRAVRIALQELYGVDELAEGTVPEIQRRYESLRKPGMYRKVLVDTAGIESCQVNYLWRAFRESRDPTLLTQDISFLGMHTNPGAEGLSRPAGIEVKDLADWHSVIRWWFDTYSPYAVAAKSQAAYHRGLDYEEVSAEDAEPIFRKRLVGDPLGPEETKRLEDHLFWFCVEQATRHSLPVKLHTGYYAGENSMPLARVAANPGELTELCRKSPETTFVFMHIAWPRWQDLLAVAKHWTNAVADMCWAWIIDPAGAKEFLKRFIVTAPATKVLPFGGDYIPVECVVGHARLARRGVARALAELVDEGWIGKDDALELVEPILRGNARRIFRLDEKRERLSRAPWLDAERGGGR